jgi:hypothetical protein
MRVGDLIRLRDPFRNSTCDPFLIVKETILTGTGRRVFDLLNCDTESIKTYCNAIEIEKYYEVLSPETSNDKPGVCPGDRSPAKT